MSKQKKKAQVRLGPNDSEAFKRLQEAFISGRYMVTITIHDSAKRELNHRLITNNFPTSDVMQSLSEIEKLAKKEIGQAIIQKPILTARESYRRGVKT